MIGLDVSGDAAADLTVIADGLSDFSVAAALRFLDDFESAILLLRTYPGLGRQRSGARGDYRTWPFGQYLIVFTVESDTLKVSRVVHGSRDLSKL